MFECATIPFEKLVETRMLMVALTLRIDATMDAELTRLASVAGSTTSEVAREMLRRQLAVCAFRELRKQALPHSQASGLVCDTDVFRDVPAERWRRPL